MRIEEQELRDAAGYGSVAKGYDYYNKQMVLRCEVLEQRDKLVVLKSEVAGSGINIYKQHIKLLKSSNRLQLSGGCNCPVGFNCKHVFAACLEYINHLQSVDPDKKIKKWIEKIVKSTKKEKLVSDHIQSEYFLTYRVFSDEDKYYKEDVKFYKSKFLKNGNISKGSKISSDNLIYGYSYDDIVDARDKELLSLLKGVIPKFSSSESQELRGELGNIILKKLIKTGRCFYKDTQEVLTFSDELKTIEFSWENIDEKCVKLESNLNKDFKFLNTIPLMAIDKEESVVYEFAEDINGELISLLNDAPPIPKEEISEVFEVLSSTIDNYTLPIPNSFELKTIDTKPIPVLKLYREDQNGFKFHSMQLDFAYGDFLITHFPVSEEISFLQDSVKFEILRDLDLEVKAIDILENLGFTKQIKDSSLYFISLAQPNMQTALYRWSEFLDTHISILEQQGWDIVIDDSFTMKFDEASNLIVESDRDDINDWFSLSFDVEFNGVSRPLVNMISPILEEFDSFEILPDIVNIEVEDNHFLKIDKKEIEPVLKTIFALFDKKDKDGDIKLSSYEAHLLEDMDKNIIFKGSDELIQLSKNLKNFEGLEDITPPNDLKASLREYQQDGLNWLNFLYEFKFGGILADDMGLGKTIQTISHFCKLKEDGKLNKPSIIIMPTSLIANWKNEIKRFTSNLTVLSLHGTDRFDNFEKIKEFDIVLTTYNLVVRDFELLEKKQFLYIVLDEAQKIKNPRTKMTNCIKSLQSEYRLALSGTPIENHLGELWSIFSFLMPGFLDTLGNFKKEYQTPIEKENDKQKQEKLNKRIKPFMIRRTKDEVADELPPKSEIIKYTQFESKQSKLYETIRVTMEKKVKDAINKNGLNKSHITILDALLKLRQVCCDPSLLKIDGAKNVKDSAKLELFLDLVDELLSEGKKILVFSQFTSMLSIIEDSIDKKGIRYTKLTGSTKDRESAIDKFTKADADIFLISLKAGGVGLNLVEADTVIHYDPWWNPAVENQATDRAYRIGQTKAVFVYKLIVENSIEQKIIELQKKKQALQDGIYDEKKDDKDIFKGEELLELLKS
ncbi:MAG: SNF2-related protein [Campylobacterota bacterium]|nr:SNF2-related protein [Campylobacterota bacterium]